MGTASDMSALDDRVQWLEDSAVHCCTSCSEDFTLFRRKHHCRACGGIFCSECSETRKHVPGYVFKARVCDECRGSSSSAEKLERAMRVDTPTGFIHREKASTPTGGYLEWISLCEQHEREDASLRRTGLNSWPEVDVTKSLSKQTSSQLSCDRAVAYDSDYYSLSELSIST